MKRKPTQNIAPFILLGILLGMTPTLLEGMPNVGVFELNVWGFIGALIGGGFVGAIAGTFLYIYLPRIMKRMGM